MEFTNDLKEKIIKELNEKISRTNKNFKCPICYNKNFSVIDGFTRRGIDKNLSQISLGGPSIPSISIICSNCGYIADFAIGILRFLEEKEDENKN